MPGLGIYLDGGIFTLFQHQSLRSSQIRRSLEESLVGAMVSHILGKVYQLRIILRVFLIKPLGDESKKLNYSRYCN